MRRNARVLLLITFIALFVALQPAAALAQETDESEEGLLLRVNGPVTIGSQETIDNVIVISDNATVDGTVTGSLFVINGDATINGRVQEDVTVIRGTLTLGPTAQVDDVSIVRGDLVRDAGATVTGSITEGDYQFSAWDWGVLSAFIWVGATFVVLVSGLIFAAIGARQLKAAGDTAIQDIGPTLLGVLAAWIVLPILMVLVFFTLVGIPLSIGFFLFVLPVIWFLGYLVAGTQLGRMILRSRSDAAHPYLAALIGLIILQVVGIIPFLGGMIAFLAGILGSGALLVLAWRAWRGPGAQPAPPQVQVTSPTPST